MSVLEELTKPQKKDFIKNLNKNEQDRFTRLSVLDDRKGLQKKLILYIELIENVLVLLDIPQDVGGMVETSAFEFAKLLQDYRKEEDLPLYENKNMKWLEFSPLIEDNRVKISKKFGVKDVEELENPELQLELVRKFINNTLTKQDLLDAGLEEEEEEETEEEEAEEEEAEEEEEEEEDTDIRLDIHFDFSNQSIIQLKNELRELNREIKRLKNYYLVIKYLETKFEICKKDLKK